MQVIKMAKNRIFLVKYNRGEKGKFGMQVVDKLWGLWGSGNSIEGDIAQHPYGLPAFQELFLSAENNLRE